jgi:hypothetical protein
MSKIACSGEATSVKNGTVTRHFYVYFGSRKSTYSDGKGGEIVSVWFGLSYRGFIGPFFFEGTVTGPACFGTSILTAIHQLYGNEPFYFQQDGTPPHCH